MILNAPDFNLEATLESGQVFGFKKITDGTFEGFLFGNLVQISQIQDQLWVAAGKSPLSEKDFRTFFDLDRDLKPLYKILNQEETLRGTYEKFKGLRLIQQDSWEALAGFIISSNNNIKRIQKIWKNLSEHFCPSQDRFPSPGEIAKAKEADLRRLGLGYRAPFLLKTAKAILKNPEQIDQIRRADYEKAKELLLKYPGVGEKVADCVLLFGFQKYEAFPVDVWIARAMKKLYFKKRKVSESKIADFARKRWGKNAGYIQQYLFHAARAGVL